jgi:thymidylate synthase ThyX
VTYKAEILLDSISKHSCRLTTFRCTYPRFVHTHILTHRVFSRCTASSRAIPTAKLIEQAVSDPVMPLVWGSNQRGMQAGEPLAELQTHRSSQTWLEARDAAVRAAKQLQVLGSHKQLVNRVLEPYLWVTCIISSTEWDNFFKLRCHSAAQPEIRHIAELMRSALAGSQPEQRSLHMPMVSPEDMMSGAVALHDWMMVSAGRCARVSYLGRPSTPERDLELARRLHRDGHYSPFEHVAYADDPSLITCNYRGWLQLRHDLETQRSV